MTKYITTSSEEANLELKNEIKNPLNIKKAATPKAKMKSLHPTGLTGTAKNEFGSCGSNSLPHSGQRRSFNFRKS